MAPLTSLQLPTVQSDGHKMSLLQEVRVLGLSRCWQSLAGTACSSEPMVWMHNTVRFFSPWGPHVAEHASHSPAHHLQTHVDTVSIYLHSVQPWGRGTRSGSVGRRAGWSSEMLQPPRVEPQLACPLMARVQQSTWQNQTLPKNVSEWEKKKNALSLYGQEAWFSVVQHQASLSLTFFIC